MAILCSDSIGVTENFLWFVSHEGFLVRINIATGVSEIIEEVADKMGGFGTVIDNIIYIDKHIYFVNQHGTKLMKYGIEDNMCCIFEIPYNFKMIKHGCFSLIDVFHHSIYMIARDLSIVVIFDLAAEEFYIEENATNMLSKFCSNQLIDDAVISTSNGEKVFFVIPSSNRIIVWDRSNNSIIDFVCEEMDGYCVHIILDDQSLILLTATGKIIKLNLFNKHIITKLKIPHRVDYEYGKIVASSKKWFVFPSIGNDIYIVDKVTTIYTKLHSFPKDFTEVFIAPDNWSKYYGIACYNNKAWLANRMYNYIMYIDLQDDTVEWYKISEVSNKSLIKNIVAYNAKINESFISLEEFIKCV